MVRFVQQFLPLHPGANRRLRVPWRLTQLSVVDQQMTSVAGGLEDPRDNGRLVCADRPSRTLLNQRFVLAGPMACGELPAPGPIACLQPAQTPLKLGAGIRVPDGPRPRLKVGRGGRLLAGLQLGNLRRGPLQAAPHLTPAEAGLGAQLPQPRTEGLPSTLKVSRHTREGTRALNSS